MKKIIKVVLILGIMGMLCQYFCKCLINKHDRVYSLISSDNKRYLIEEKFRKVKDNHSYYFTVKNKNKTFSFSVFKDLDKQEEIINDIRYYKKDNLVCIFPIYKRNTVSDVYCSLDNMQVSYSYLKQIYNPQIDWIIKQIQKNGYDISKNDSKKIKKGDFISIYTDNVIEDYIYTVWDYKGIYIVKDGTFLKKDLLRSDKYENNLSMLVGKYYVTFDTDIDSGVYYNGVILYNIKDGGRDEIMFEDSLSLNTYINGVYKNRLYITDNDTKKQYVLDPDKRNIKEVGDKDIGFISVNNNKLLTIRSNKDNYFSDSVLNSKITKLYGNVLVKKNKDNYYFLTNNGYVYEIINNNYKKPVLLFKFDGIKEFRVKDDAISFIVNDTIYSYTDQFGLKPIIVDSELKYNYKNIYDFMKK